MNAELKGFIEHRPLFAYFFLAFIITWVLISPLALSAQGIITASVSPHIHALGAAGPILSALIVTFVIGGRGGVSRFLSRLVNWRIGWLWLCVAFLSPPLLFTIGVLLVRLTGGPWPDFKILATAEYAGLEWIAATLLSALAYGIGEETGWRGFALPRLQQNRSALSATFILSLFWALWHAPMFLYRFELGLVQSIGFFMGMFSGAVVLTFFYNSTAGSIFMVAAWHASWNVANIIGLAVSMEVVSLMSTMVMVAALIIVVMGRPARLSFGEKFVVRDGI